MATPAAPAPADDGTLPKIPNMEIAQWAFLLTRTGNTDEALKAKILAAIEADGWKWQFILFY